MESAGLHLIMDAYVEDSAVFNREYLETMFAGVITSLDMKPLDEPRFYQVPVDPKVLERVKRTGRFEDEGGCSMLQVITTSHLSIHTWELQKFFSLDVFSCKDFDADLALSIVKSFLWTTAESITVVHRRKPELAERVTLHFQP